jgi:hypothetical protein
LILIFFLGYSSSFEVTTFKIQAPTFLALIILVTGGVVCMAVVSLLKLEQFFEQGTNINSIRIRMTPNFVFTGSVIIRASGTK